MSDPRSCLCGGKYFRCYTCETEGNRGYESRRRGCCREGYIRCTNCYKCKSDVAVNLQATRFLQNEPRSSDVSDSNKPQTERYLKHRAYYNELWDSFQVCIKEAPFREPEPECDGKGVAYVEFQPLVFHCKVFVLAEKYLASSLMKLAVQKLHDSLVKLPRDTGSIHDIMHVLEYCFEVTGGSKTSHEGALAKMVVAYAAARAPELKELGEFRALLAGNPDMASKFVMALG